MRVQVQVVQQVGQAVRSAAGCSDDIRILDAVSKLSRSCFDAEDKSIRCRLYARVRPNGALEMR